MGGRIILHTLFAAQIFALPQINLDGLDHALQHSFTRLDDLPSPVLASASVAFNSPDIVINLGGCSEVSGNPALPSFSCSQLAQPDAVVISDGTPVDLGVNVQRFKHSATTFGNNLQKAIVVGGLNGNNEPDISVNVLDLTADPITYTEFATLPEGVIDGVAFTVLGSSYYMLGYTVNGNGEIVGLNHQVFEFSERGGVEQFEIPDEYLRGGASAAVVGSHVYILGGSSDTSNFSPLSTMLVFDPLNRDVSSLVVHSSAFSAQSADTLSELITPRRNAAALQINERVYLLGGIGNQNQPTSEIHIFNPKLNQWFHGGHLTGEIGISHFTAVTLTENRAILIGGLTSDSAISQTSTLLEDQTDVYSDVAFNLHGSGTTNPSELFWRILHNLKVGSRVSMEMSYRAIGSSNGIAEFLGDEASGFRSFNHFASADVPLTSSQRQAILDRGEEVAQIPFMFGGIGIFCHIPEASSTAVFTRRMLTKIYKAEVTVWSDLYEDMKAADPSSDFEWLKSLDKEILAIYRSDGSSSTSAFTRFLASDSNWEDDLQGTRLEEWPCQDRCEDASGSGLVQRFLENRPYSIAYLSRGHGYPAAAVEAAISHNGKVRKMSEEEILLAVDQGNILSPADGDESQWIFSDFSEFSLFVDDDSFEGWPMCLASFIFVKKDVSGLGLSALTLDAFLRYLVSEEDGRAQSFVSDFLFAPLLPRIMEWVNQGLNELIFPEASRFVFEADSDTSIGSSPMSIAISTSIRNTYENLQFENLERSLNSMEPLIEQLRSDIRTLEEEAGIGSGYRVAAVFAIIITVLFVILNGFLFSKIFKQSKEIKELKALWYGSSLAKSPGETSRSSDKQGGFPTSEKLGEPEGEAGSSTGNGAELSKGAVSKT